MMAKQTQMLPISVLFGVLFNMHVQFCPNFVQFLTIFAQLLTNTLNIFLNFCLNFAQLLTNILNIFLKFFECDVKLTDLRNFNASYLLKKEPQNIIYLYEYNYLYSRGKILTSG